MRRFKQYHRFISSAFCGVALAGCAAEAPSRIEKHCVSPSGESQFFIQIDRMNDTGRLRYQFFDQDIGYLVEDIIVAGNTLSGKARFDASATGEVRGTDVNFTFNFETNAFLDGSLEYSCMDLQDRDLLDLPAPTA